MIRIQRHHLPHAPPRPIPSTCAIIAKEMHPVIAIEEMVLLRAADSSLMPTFIRKQRTLGMVFGGALLTLSLSACGQTAPSATHQPSTITIKSSGMTSLWSYRPHPLVALKPFNVNVSLRTANGKPVTNAHIVVSLHMTIMDMPHQTMVLQNVGHGHYQGHGIFLMAGTWDMTANVDALGHHTKENISVNVSD
ncbi:hypothetical protein CO251_07180 [Sulfobacillus sp. hq2]|nr:hypothetical protein CO251_07180 [Sulfobacillus sp. hq2]